MAKVNCLNCPVIRSVVAPPDLTTRRAPTESAAMRSLALLVVFLLTLSIFLVGGADNKGPVGLGGRLVATIWMLASVIAVWLLTASLSALLTLNSLAGDISGPNDLPGQKVATVGGSTSETWLGKLGASGGQRVSVQVFPNIPTASMPSRTAR